MPQTTVFTKDLEEWTPAIDPRKQPKAGIVAGRNFLDDVDGPRAAFASQFVNFNLFDQTSRAKILELRIGTSIIYGCPTGLFRIDPVTLTAQWILSITTTQTYWPWSVALVGGVYYFAQFNIGLWQYDPVANTMTLVSGAPFGLLCRGITQSAGRLLYITDTAVGCSAQDDGTNLAPSTVTAAQAVPLSLVGKTAYRIDEVADGAIVSMAEGLLKVEIVQANFVFRFYPLSTKLGPKIFSPNAVTSLPDVGLVLLDDAGLWQTDGGKPEPFEPLMGSYIKDNFIRSMDHTKYGVMNLYYSVTERLFFIATSVSTHEGLMQVTVCFNLPNGRWSSFDHDNQGMFEVFNPVDGTYNLAYMGPDGYMRAAYNDTNIAYGIPAFPYGINDYIYRPQDNQLQEQNVIVFNDGVTLRQRGFTEFLFSDNIPTAYSHYTQTNLYYIPDTPFSDTDLSAISGDFPIDVSGPTLHGGCNMMFFMSGGVEQIASVFTPPIVTLDSYLAIGPFRFTDQNDAVQTSQIQTLVLGTSVTVSFIIFENYNTENVQENWSDPPDTFENWSAGTDALNVFKTILSTTNDGITDLIQGDELLPVTRQFGAANQYAPIGWDGVYHTITVSTENPGDIYSLKQVDITGLLTGVVEGVF